MSSKLHAPPHHQHDVAQFQASFIKLYLEIYSPGSLASPPNFKPIIGRDEQGDEVTDVVLTLRLTRSGCLHPILALPLTSK